MRGFKAGVGVVEKGSGKSPTETGMVRGELAAVRALTGIARLAVRLCAGSGAAVAVVGNDGPDCVAAVGLDAVRGAYLVRRGMAEAAAGDFVLPLRNSSGHLLGFIVVAGGTSEGADEGALRGLAETAVEILGLWRAEAARAAVEEELRASEERLNRSQKFANIGSWEWNFETGALFWTERIAALFGHAPGEMEHTYENFLASVHPEDRAGLEAAVQACLDTGEDYEFEHRIVWPDGRVRWMLERGNVVRDAAGRPTRMLGIVQDITELRRAREEAEAANRAKSEFLSNMSHELRTPLNAILGFAQFLQMSPDQPLTVKQNDYVEQILTGGEHLLDLINEVLDLAKVEAGRIDFVYEPISPAHLFQECLKLTAMQAKARGIRVVDRLAESLPPVHSDYMRLKQVLLNLLSNAVKYNRPNGTVTVTGECCDSFLRIAVEDTGPGIDEARLGRVFTPFDRLGAEAEDTEGTGLGLPISKTLIESMGGTIGVHSRQGVGTRFWIDVPLAGAEAQLTA